MRLRTLISTAVTAPLALLGLATVSIGTANAATTPVPLTGEFLSNLAPARTVSGACEPTGTTTIEFTVSGVAAGPYPGTFVETGTAVIGPQTDEFVTGQYRGPIVGFSADFTITSALGQVNGHKELASGASTVPDVGNAGACFTDTLSGGAIAQVASSRLVYTATTPFGEDSGTTFVNMNTYPDPVANSSSNQFREGFSSPNPVLPQCSNGLDDDGDGQVDYPADPGCSSPTDTSESPDPAPQFQCSNGLDDDGDGRIDYPADPGCTSPTDDSESPNPPATVTLTPPDAVNTVGTTHTVTATVADATAAPVPATTVLFSVSGTDTTSGSCTTDASGQCSFTYSGPAFPGADLITGCADANANGGVDPGEPCATATKAWILPSGLPPLRLTRGVG